MKKSVDLSFTEREDRGQQRKDPSDVLLAREYVELDQLAGTFIKENAQMHSEEFETPIENLKELGNKDYLSIVLSKDSGGWGKNADTKEPSEYLQAIRLIARGCSSTAHCFQVHSHSSWLFDSLGTKTAKDKYLDRIKSGELLMGVVGAEVNRPDQYLFSTTARRVNGGYIINGTKTYATNGQYSSLLIIFASVEGASTPEENHIMLLVDPAESDGVTVDSDWYRPLGMRATVSPTVKLDNVFVPDENVVGTPGEYPKGRWQGKYHLGFTATYLGSMEGALNFILKYTRKREDPVIQHRVGEIELKIKAAEALFYEAIRKWQRSHSLETIVDAEIASMKAKAFASKSALEIAEALNRIGGATATFEQYPFGRFVRDMFTHTVHGHYDMTLKIIGRSKLGLEFDSTREVGA